jgi:hypothetical protein
MEMRKNLVINSFEKCFFLDFTAKEPLRDYNITAIDSLSDNGDIRGQGNSELLHISSMLDALDLQ